MKIISFDPGGHTGITYWEYKKNNLSLIKAEVVEDYLNWDYSILKKYDLIIVEDFLLYPGKAQSMIFNRFVPVQIIGIIKYFANKYQKEIVFQKAADAKRVVSNDVLKHYKCYTKITHTRDSARHAIFYFFKNADLKAINKINL